MRINQIIRLTLSKNLNHRKILLCAHWNSHDHLSHSVLYKKSFTVQTMDKCWPSCDIYEFQLSFSPSVPIFCMVICWQIFIVILGPERPEEMHLKIHTEKLVVQLWSYNFFFYQSWFNSAPFGLCIQRGTGFSDMDARMWLVSAFFKIEYWNSRDKLLLWFREASQNLS